MAGKVPFDPKKHLLKPVDEDDNDDIDYEIPPAAAAAMPQPARIEQKPSIVLPTTDSKGQPLDDAALALMLQEQYLQEDRHKHNVEAQQQQQQSSRGEMTDSELARMMQNEQFLGHTNVARRQHSQENEMNDSTLARIIQYQEEDRQFKCDAEGAMRDSELARIMQSEEDMQSHRGSGASTVSNHTADQLEYARNLQQQALDNVRQQQQQHLQHRRTSSDGGSGDFRSRTASSGVESVDDDFEVARRMQELEAMGMGRMNSGRFQDINPNDYQQSPFETSTHSAPPRSQQEDDDERFARFLNDGGANDRTMGFTDPPGSHGRSRSAASKSPPPSGGKRSNRTVSVPTTSNRNNRHTNTAGSPAAILDDNNYDPLQVPSSAIGSKKEKKRLGGGGRFIKNLTKGMGFGGGSGEKDENAGDSSEQRNRQKKPERRPINVAPAAIPPPPSQTGPSPITHRPGPLPHSVSINTQVGVSDAPQGSRSQQRAPKPASTCCVCGAQTKNFLIALDKKYHAECFNCTGCHTIIDPSGPFAYMTDETGEKHPLHRQCYAELYGVKCAICKQSIPAGPNGMVSYVKHPFFDTEQMCPRHASNPGRRCTGCHRFEPEGSPFPDLEGGKRCVCYSCCRTVVVDGNDAKPLWKQVIDFFEFGLKLPIWKDLRQVPILIVGYDALNDQLNNVGGAHQGATQIMTRGLCLTEHASGRRLKMSRLKFSKNNFSFEAVDAEEKGFTYFQVPDANKENPDSSVTAILCLSGLPKDLTASVLAHEATHAWIKLHPRFDITNPVPPQVEEGVAQLVAMLFLAEGLEPASTETFGDSGPSDQKLRQYFRFSIETDDHEIYGEGYRKAAKAYADIGIEALLSHIVLYQDFPTT